MMKQTSIDQYFNKQSESRQMRASIDIISVPSKYRENIVYKRKSIVPYKQAAENHDK